MPWKSDIHLPAQFGGSPYHLCGIGHTQFLHDTAAVKLYGIGTYAQPDGHLSSRQSPGCL